MTLLFQQTGGETRLPESHVIRFTDYMVLTEDAAYYGTMVAPGRFVVSSIDPPLGGCPF
jgi:hypothetical protein